MLALPVRVVADADRARALVAGQVVEDLLRQGALAVDAVHDLELLVALGDVGDEVEVVVRLPVEPERVEAPQGEGRVADPAVAVVPVALAAGRLGQRGGRRGDDRAARRVGEALQRQGRALEVRAPRVVGERAAGQPVLPVVRRPHQPLVRVVDAARRGRLVPGQRAEALLALLDERARHGARPLEADVHVAREDQLDVRPVAHASALVVAVLGVAPRAVAAAVVEDRLAVEGQLHLAVHAADHAQQDVAGVVVGRRPALGVRSLLDVPPRTDEQHVADDDPAGRRAPARLEDHRAGQVAARGRDGDVGRPEAEAAGVAIEDRRRRRSASRGAAGTATRRCRTARRGRSSRSRRGTRTRRSARMASCRTADRARSAPVTAAVRSCSSSPSRVRGRQSHTFAGARQPLRCRR